MSSAGFTGTGRSRVHEVLDGEELVAVVTLPKDVDSPPFANPVEEDLEDPQAFRADERLRPDDRGVHRGDAAEGLCVDLRLAVLADADERIVLFDRMFLRHAV